MVKKPELPWTEYMEYDDGFIKLAVEKMFVRGYRKKYAVESVTQMRSGKWLVKMARRIVA